VNAIVKDVMSTHMMVIGVVSEADLLTKEALAGELPGAFHTMTHHREQAKAAALTAADLMTKPAVTIRPDERVSRAARLMYTRRVKRLPVTAEDGTLIGQARRGRRRGSRPAHLPAPISQLEDERDQHLGGVLVGTVGVLELLGQVGLFTDGAVDEEPAEHGGHDQAVQARGERGAD